MNLDCLQISQNKTTAKGGAMVRSLIPFIPPFFREGWAGGFRKYQKHQSDFLMQLQKCPIIFRKFCTWWPNFVTRKIWVSISYWHQKRRKRICQTVVILWNSRSQSPLFRHPLRVPLHPLWKTKGGRREWWRKEWALWSKRCYSPAAFSTLATITTRTLLLLPPFEAFFLVVFQ